MIPSKKRHKYCADNQWQSLASGNPNRITFDNLRRRENLFLALFCFILKISLI